MIKKTAVLVLLPLALILFPAGLSTASAQTKTLTPKTLTRPPGEAMRAEYTIKALDFYLEGKNYGFNVNCHPLSAGSNCLFDSNVRPARDLLLAVGSKFKVIGSKCDFTVFEPAQLKNGFVFKSFVGRQSLTTSADKAKLELRSSPAAGSTSVKFVFHGWAESLNTAEYRLESIVLEGPAGRDWKEAIR